jgi:hypothetical protein
LRSSRLKNEDGSRRQSAEDAPDGLEKRLRRENRTDDEVAAALSLFGNAAMGTPVEIDGETFHGEMPNEFGLPFDGCQFPTPFPR